ncbi:helix-turn-helix domain-containing protein [Anaeromyxobacter dehalogenans]|uniref:Transcriptional regulator, XRE family n=1 Tax=Anaeromyxobacter dehalogenans (strain 2CP-C) TaxID=290397 RepID=Q2IKW5_ANADE|nr:helix-turn-helix transcriptional regulator [Anaeromyxobacter dehalogenans]ABC82295.1 transcriptional regulator, XRE family [Anaeromyxobacter dehalogenans 2CP-C]
MKVNDRLRAQRTKLGLTDAEVASGAQLSRDEFRDLEQHEDEAVHVLHLRNLRLLCEVLGVDALDLLGIPCASCAGSDVGRSRGGRHDVVRERRVALGLSQADLADRIGFEAGVVDDIERDPDYLERWSAGLVLSLAEVLAVPPQVLLDVRCPKCGR